MARAYLGLGGNIGDVRATIAAAVDRLAARGATVVARSADYGTPPWGKLDQPPYVNACVALETDLAPADLLALVLSIEQEFGRRRLEKWGPRSAATCRPSSSVAAAIPSGIPASVTGQKVL